MSSLAADGAREMGALEVPALRRGRLPLIPWVSATLIDLTAAVLVCRRGSLTGALAAGALHLASLAPIALAALAPSERALGLAFAFAIPVLGAPLAALSLRTVGRCELGEVDPEAPPADVETPSSEELRRLGEALPTCEALLAGGADERRAIIATLTVRADAGSVALLRWALGAANPELAVEAALAIEEMTASFEARLGAHRQMLAAKASGADALAAAELATDSIEAGLAEASLVPSLAEEARGYYTAALVGDPARATTVAIGRARLELAVLHPDAALTAIDEVMVTDGSGPAVSAVELHGPEGLAAAEMEMLLALRDEAVLATHALPWESASALASYHPASPPPLVQRRLSAARRLSGLHPRGATGGGGVTVGVVQVPAPASTREVQVPAAASTREVPVEKP
jgi:hypothetical protein